MIDPRLLESADGGVAARAAATETTRHREEPSRRRDASTYPFHLEIHETLPSTSDHCIAAARAGEPENLAILARYQTAARGSRGRTWITGDNNLALSILLRPNTPAADAGQWALLAGLAVIEALTPYLDDPGRLHLKWPNDILLDGAKVAGILIDTEMTSSGRLAWLVLGIGVNLATAPALPERDTATFGIWSAPETIAGAILTHLNAWRSRLCSEGFTQIRQSWLHRAHPVGAALAVSHSEGRWFGTFAGISPDGALLLATPTGLRTITAADISLAAPSPHPLRAPEVHGLEADRTHAAAGPHPA